MKYGQITIYLDDIHECLYNIIKDKNNNQYNYNPIKMAQLNKIYMTL